MSNVCIALVIAIYNNLASNSLFPYLSLLASDKITESNSSPFDKYDGITLIPPLYSVALSEIRLAGILAFDNFPYNSVASCKVLVIIAIFFLSECNNSSNLLISVSVISLLSFFSIVTGTPFLIP